MGDIWLDPSRIPQKTPMMPTAALLRRWWVQTPARCNHGNFIGRSSQIGSSSMNRDSPIAQKRNRRASSRCLKKRCRNGLAARKAAERIASLQGVVSADFGSISQQIIS
jgi:hypothetical protein